MALLTVVALGGWATGCCGSDDWQPHSFEAAGLSFSVPASWSVTYRLDSHEPTPMGVTSAEHTGGTSHHKGDGAHGSHHGSVEKPEPDPRTTPIKDSAILTALPVLEDAALVIIAPQLERSPESFAKEMNVLVPLDGVKFSGHNPIAWQRGELKGLVFDGTGRITNKGPEVHFSTLILDMSGRSVIVTLYAEEERSEAYSEIFNRIMTSLKPIKASTPPPTPTAPSTPVPTEHADATGAAPEAPPGEQNGIRELRRSASEAVDDALRSASDQADKPAEPGAEDAPPAGYEAPSPESDEPNPDEASPESPPGEGGAEEGAEREEGNGDTEGEAEGVSPP